jgi:hypothetical protein
MKRCTGCGITNDEPLGLNRNGEPYLACCPDNHYVEITAIEWLEKEVNKENGILTKGFIILLIQQAKEMEKQQIIDAYETAMETDIYNEPLKVGKQYYNETYKQY